MNDGSARHTRANIVIVPTSTSYELDSAPPERAPRRRAVANVDRPCRGSGTASWHWVLSLLAKCAGSAKTTHVTTYSDATYSPRNYLLSGGSRATARDRDEQLLQLNRAAIKVNPIC